jgi:hypothetical protein
MSLDAKKPTPAPALGIAVQAHSPFLLSVLLAFLSWALTHVVDRATQAPLVEYSVTTEEAAHELSYCDGSGLRTAVVPVLTTYRFVNLSPTRALRGIKIEVYPVGKDPGAKLVGLRVRPDAPALGLVAEDGGPERCSPQVGTALLDLQPGDTVRLFVGSGEGSATFIRVGAAADAIALRPRGAVTVLVSHENAVILALAIMAAGLALLYLFFLARFYRQTKEPSDATA